VSPRSLSVAQSTEYNVLFYSAAGLPKVLLRYSLTLNTVDDVAEVLVR
jgi:hypothetical protein